MARALQLLHGPNRTQRLMEFIFHICGYLCHQDPERSFTWIGGSAFCARCSGFYLGAGAFVLTLLAARRGLGWTCGPGVLAVLMTLALATPGEVVLEIVGVPGSNTARFVLGVGTGVCVAAMCMSERSAHMPAALRGLGLIAKSVSGALLFSTAVFATSSRNGSNSAGIFNLASLLGLGAFIMALTTCLVRIIRDLASWHLAHKEGWDG